MHGTDANRDLQAGAATVVAFDVTGLRGEGKGREAQPTASASPVSMTVLSPDTM